ncbi:MAG: hypothetical protein L6243_00250 [Candidatus Altiarchaeales archaeon]|nr:hypothetical protein [Candidatus Altiarchaeota archaeon]MBU4267134.1 hypothetical protein [Candidatus Altiarchaeota archaeon]MBU4342167.1 hypothetical protein [Candidatus Altiarchaeota archaeon]MBU4436790.1 hypothetical protein [Candidatus Altiarchaeota archaeon]MCG2781998.1 hypothetical protein [Candidatus Altiarchaeales archaeon]
MEEREECSFIFTKSAKEDILDLLDKKVGDRGTIVEKDNPEQEVLSFESQELSLEEFGGVQKGSEVFISNNIVSLMKLAKKG